MLNLLRLLRGTSLKRRISSYKPCSERQLLALIQLHMLHRFLVVDRNRKRVKSSQMKEWMNKSKPKQKPKRRQRLRLRPRLSLPKKLKDKHKRQRLRDRKRRKLIAEGKKRSVAVSRRKKRRDKDNRWKRCSSKRLHKRPPCARDRRSNSSST